MLRKQTTNQSGFTIVELLIVIVVIGILAAVTIIAFNGVQSRANVALIQSDLSSAYRVLRNDLTVTENYPATTSATSNGEGLKASDGVVYQYTPDNNASPKTFCLTATRSNTSYYVDQTGKVTQGVCAGHTDSSAPALVITEITPPSVSITFHDLDISSDAQEIAISGTNGSVYTSGDGGVTWALRASGMSATLYFVQISDDGSRIVTSSNAGVFSNIRMSTDMGASWTTVPGGNCRWQQLAMSADGQKIVGFQDTTGCSAGGVYISSDGGATMARTSSSSYTAGAMSVSDNGSVISIPMYGYSWMRSTNGGTSFSTGPHSLTGYASAMSSTGSRIYAGVYSGSLYVSTNNGTSWTTLAGAGTQNWRYLSTSADGTKVITSSPTAGSVMKSDDSGVTWESVPGFGSSNISKAVISSDGKTIIARTGSRVYKAVFN